MVDDEVTLLSALSDTFYSAKKAKLQADMNERMAELEEMEARERALLLTKAAPAAPALSPATDLVAALEAEKAKNAALQAQLLETQLEAERSVQKVAAFWIAKLEEAKETPQLEAAAPAAAAPAANTPDLVAGEAEYLEEELTLRELRARLLTFGLSTIGLKSELRARLAYAQLSQRQQHKSWDSDKLAWL